MPHTHSARTVRRIPALHDIEIIRSDHPRGQFRYALFDFDGTLSLIREGWQAVMIPVMVEALLGTHSGESVTEIEAAARDLVERTTGIQTIYQMIALKDEVEKRGGTAATPQVYKQIYLDRLWERIKDRVAGLKAGRIDRRSLLVPGSEELLQGLKARGVALFLASGTDIAYVRDECAALGLSGYFDGIYGALDDHEAFSKKMLIERLLAEHQLCGAELITFGDGFVEIENTHDVDGVAVGVASDEAGCAGVDPWKRTRLIQAGADLIIPHYRRYDDLLAYLWPA